MALEILNRPKNEDDEDQNQSIVSGGPAISKPGGQGIQAPSVAPTQGQVGSGGKSSSGFTNIQDLLKANPGTSMISGLQSSVKDLSDAAGQQLQSGAQAQESKAGAEENRLNTGTSTINDIIANIVGDKTQQPSNSPDTTIAKPQDTAAKQYITTEQQQQIDAIRNKTGNYQDLFKLQDLAKGSDITQNLQSEANKMSTQGGMLEAVRNRLGTQPYTQGESNLDKTILGAQSNIAKQTKTFAQQQAENTRQQNQTLRDQAKQRASQVQDETDKAAQGLTEGATSGFGKVKEELTPELEAKKKEVGDYEDLLKQKLGLEAAATKYSNKGDTAEDESAGLQLTKEDLKNLNMSNLDDKTQQWIIDQSKNIKHDYQQADENDPTVMAERVKANSAYTGLQQAASNYGSIQDDNQGNRPMTMDEANNDAQKVMQGDPAFQKAQSFLNQYNDANKTINNYYDYYAPKSTGSITGMQYNPYDVSQMNFGQVANDKDLSRMAALNQMLGQNPEFTKQALQYGTADLNALIPADQYQYLTQSGPDVDTQTGMGLLNSGTYGTTTALTNVIDRLGLQNSLGSQGMIGGIANGIGTIGNTIASPIVQPIAGIGNRIGQFGSDLANKVIDPVSGAFNKIEQAVGSVICTELYERGLMDFITYKQDQAFGLNLYRKCPEAIDGYHLWAKPVVRLMKKSQLATKIVYFFAKPWSDEMAGRSNLFGATLMFVGLPICQFIGNVIKLFK